MSHEITEAALALAVVVNSFFWYLGLRSIQSHDLETAKLLASRTLSEYSWLKKAEQGTVEKPKDPAGYDTVFDEEPENG